MSNFKEKLKATKEILSTAAKYFKKHKALGTAVIAGTLVSAAVFPPAVPVVIAAGTALGYRQYKKENPKATFAHYAKSTAKGIRNQVQFDLQNTNIGQHIMKTKKRLQEKSKANISKKDIAIEIAIGALTDVMGITPQHSEKNKIISENAETARRLNHMRISKIRDDSRK